MKCLKQKLFEKIEQQRPRTKRLAKEFGDVVIDQVKVSHKKVFVTEVILCLKYLKNYQSRKVQKCLMLKVYTIYY